MVLIGKSYTAWTANAQALGLGKHNYCRYGGQVWTEGQGGVWGGRWDAYSHVQGP